MNAVASTGPALTPSADSDSKAGSVARIILLQASHRLGAVALFSTLATWGMMYAIKDFHLPLAITAGTADAGLCCALAARMLTRPVDFLRREANGVAIFNGILFLLAIHLMLFARLDVIRAAAGEFFTPSGQTLPHE